MKKFLIRFTWIFLVIWICAGSAIVSSLITKNPFIWILLFMLFELIAITLRTIMVHKNLMFYGE